MPPAVFGKMYNHVLTDKGLELFDEDWSKVTSNSGPSFGSFSQLQEANPGNELKDVIQKVRECSS